MTQPIQTSGTGPRWVFSTRLHVFLYSFLLIATPFLMLREHMQEVMGQVSALHIHLFGAERPIIPWAAGLLVVLILILWRRHITRLRLAAFLIALGLVALAQQITDYYFAHNFYDIQQNWHYFAYAGFTFMLFRDLVPRGVRPAKIILLTFAFALLFSSFDEGFQRWINTRTFDMSDISKDGWGAVTGMALLYMGENPTGAMLRSIRPIRHRSLRGYLTHPFSAWLLCFLFILSLLSMTSVLSEDIYVPISFGLGVAGFLILFLIIHFSQFRLGKMVLLTLLGIVVVVQGFFFLRYRNDNIVYSRPGLIVYKGIPVPFFDILIRPNGTFRIVDRKKYFYMRDRQFFMSRRPDILLMASGHSGSGGHGFPEQGVTQFNWNLHLKRGTQVIVLPNAEACQLYNRLKEEDKNVLFVYHNTE